MLCSLIIVLPLFNLIYFLLFSNILGVGYVYFSILVIFVIVIFPIFLLFNIIINYYIYYIKFSDWADYYDFFVSIDFIFDKLSSIMLLVVVLIALFVQSFSKWYMYQDPYYYKFFFFLNFFVFFMIPLVLFNNIVFIFVGWEGIGTATTPIFQNKLVVAFRVIAVAAIIILIMTILTRTMTYSEVNNK